jgi:hypothetical protein
MGQHLLQASWNPIRRSDAVDTSDVLFSGPSFDSLPPSAVKSVRHRWLLKEWEFGRGKLILPLFRHLDREEYNRYRGEFSVFEVRREDALRFLLRSHGTFIGKAYGSNCVGKYLDEIVPPELHGQQLEPYRQAVRHRRPVYVSSDTRDTQGKPVQFERLLMPFSEDGAAAACVVADFEMISVEGHFSPDDMLTAKNSAPSGRVAGFIAPPKR